MLGKEFDLLLRGAQALPPLPGLQHLAWEHVKHVPPHPPPHPQSGNEAVSTLGFRDSCSWAGDCAPLRPRLACVSACVRSVPRAHGAPD